jgi:hypothetical protein
MIFQMQPNQIEVSAVTSACKSLLEQAREASTASLKVHATVSSEVIIKNLDAIMGQLRFPRISLRVASGGGLGPI